jgi:hypothetical protein
VNKAEVTAILTDALTQGIICQADVLHILHDAGDKYPDYASKVQTDDDLEVDDKPLFSYGEDGVWVSAWVHIRHPETPETE